MEKDFQNSKSSGAVFPIINPPTPAPRGWDLFSTPDKFFQPLLSMILTMTLLLGCFGVGATAALSGDAVATLHAFVHLHIPNFPRTVMRRTVMRMMKMEESDDNDTCTKQ